MFFKINFKKVKSCELTNTFVKAGYEARLLLSQLASLSFA